MNLYTASPLARRLAFILITLCGVAACGQKGPLIVEQPDPFATDALQTEANDIEAEKSDSDPQ